MTFTIINDAVVITRTKGVFHQRKVYERKGFIYTAYGSGFIRLVKNGTHIPNVGIEDLDLGFTPDYTSLGYMIRPEQA
jgi:hypothetical protein